MIVKAVRVTLAQQVVDGVRTFISDGGLRPGDPLPSEASLAAQFGVSRPVVREALGALAATGLVTIVNGRGAIVRPIDGAPLRAFFERAVELDDKVAIRELMEVRAGIEMQASALAAERITPEQLASVREIVDEMGTALRRPDDYNDLDLAFHMQIAEATGNAMIVHLMESLRGVLSETIRQGLGRRRTKALRERGYGLHLGIVAALAIGDPAEARDAMQAHFDDALVLFAPKPSPTRRR